MSWDGSGWIDGLFHLYLGGVIKIMQVNISLSMSMVLDQGKVKFGSAAVTYL